MTKQKESLCFNDLWVKRHIYLSSIFTVRSQYRNIRIHQATGPVAQGLQEVLWTEFTAKYLPLLVDRLLDLPPHGARPNGAEDYPLQNIYYTVLRLTHPAYLVKFMASSHPVAEGTLQLI